MNATWPTIPLGDVLRRSERTIPLDSETIYKEVTVRMNGKGVVERRQVKGIEIAADRRYKAKSGQFIISRIDARNGASGLVPDELNGAVVTNDFPLFDVAEDRLDAAFLGWMSKTRSFIELCKHASEGTTNRVRLSEDRFKALTIALPRLDEQRRIVARVEELAAKVDEARGLRSLTVDELAALRSTQSRRVFESLEAATVPLEMVCAAIIDNLHSNPIYAEGGTVPCIRSSDVGFGVLDLANARRTDEDEYRRRTVRGELQVDDIVLVREGGGTGKCALVLPEHRFSLGQRVMMLRPDRDKVLPKFFLYQLLSPIIQEDHVQPLSKGSASPHLNIGSLRRFPFLLPSVNEQARIVENLDALQAKLEAVKTLQTETAAELDAMLPAILDKAFRGELA
jgi:type I restriction enzyme S subunit